MNLYLKNEQNLLRISIFSTNITCEYWNNIWFTCNTSTIIFDSIYAMIDAVMTTLALIVARLITSSTSKILFIINWKNILLWAFGTLNLLF